MRRIQEAIAITTETLQKVYGVGNPATEMQFEAPQEIADLSALQILRDVNDRISQIASEGILGSSRQPGSTSRFNVESKYKSQKINISFEGGGGDSGGGEVTEVLLSENSETAMESQIDESVSGLTETCSAFLQQTNASEKTEAIASAESATSDKARFEDKTDSMPDASEILEPFLKLDSGSDKKSLSIWLDHSRAEESQVIPPPPPPPEQPNNIQSHAERGRDKYEDSDSLNEMKKLYNKIEQNIEATNQFIELSKYKPEVYKEIPKFIKGVELGIQLSNAYLESDNFQEFAYKVSKKVAYGYASNKVGEVAAVLLISVGASTSISALAGVAIGIGSQSAIDKGTQASLRMIEDISAEMAKEMSRTQKMLDEIAFDMVNNPIKYFGY